MANQNAPFGMGAITRTGSEFVGSLNRYFIPDTDGVIMAVGDPVVSAGGSDVDGIATVTRAAAADSIRGYIVGFLPLTRTQEDLPNYRPANVETYVMVADDPSARIIIQANGSVTAADIGLNADFVVTNANSTTGRSQVQLNTATVNVTATLPLKIIGLYEVDDNELATANPRLVCSFNIHELKADLGSLGK